MKHNWKDNMSYFLLAAILPPETGMERTIRDTWVSYHHHKSCLLGM